jgi:hypothetical protein
VPYQELSEGQIAELNWLRHHASTSPQDSQCIMEVDSAWTSNNAVRCGCKAIASINGKRVCMHHAFLVLRQIAEKEGIDFYRIAEDWSKP